MMNDAMASFLFCLIGYAAFVAGIVLTVFYYFVIFMFALNFLIILVMLLIAGYPCVVFLFAGLHFATLQIVLIMIAGKKFIQETTFSYHLGVLAIAGSIYYFYTYSTFDLHYFRDLGLGGSYAILLCQHPFLVILFVIGIALVLYVYTNIWSRKH